MLPHNKSTVDVWYEVLVIYNRNVIKGEWNTYLKIIPKSQSYELEMIEMRPEFCSKNTMIE